MSPDDPEDGAVAIAPPDPPPEEEAVPASEQEQVVPEEEPTDSGAAGPEEEAPEEKGEEGAPGIDAIMEAIDDLAERDPEAAQRLRAKYTPEGADEQLARTAAETRATSRQTTLGQIANVAVGYVGDALKTKHINPIVQRAADAAKKKAEVLVKEAMTSTEPVAVGDLVDVNALAEEVAKVANEGQGLRGSWQAATTQGAVDDVLDLPAVQRLMSKEQQDAVAQTYEAARSGQMSPHEALAWRVSIALNAAVAAAPEEIKRVAVEDAEKQVELEKTRHKTLELLGTGNGQKARRGDTPKTISDKDLLADPTTPVEKLMEIRARQRAG